MKKLLLSSFASALAFAAYLPAQAEVIESTTETQKPAQVIDSYMKPTVSREKSVTTSDGTTEKTVEPLIQERQERVIVPTEKVTTRRVAHHVAHRHMAVARPATSSSSVSVRHTVVEPQVVQQSQTVEQKAVVIDRPDPALKLP